MDKNSKKKELALRSSAAEYLTFVASTGDSDESIEMRYEDENIWLTQKMMAALYDVDIRTINEHIKKIYDDHELSEEATIRNFRIVQAEGGRQVNRELKHYTLQMIIAVGFKVNNPRAVQFRKWAGQIVKDHTIQGWTMDKERLKKGHMFTDEYFERQLQYIREIRLSERKFYQKVTDLYATAFDYDKDARTTRLFFQTVQNKLHYAVHRHTAAELIVERADAAKEHMGLATWENAPDGKIVKADVTVAKNYLSEKEMSYLERIVSLYLDYAELQAERKIPMSMARPTVRSLEMMILTFEEVDSAYLKEFWRCVSEMTDCSIFAIRFPEEKRNITAYMEKLHEVFVYLSELFLTAAPLNEKMSVLLGIATYSYKRLKEIYEHQLFNSISGRSCVRVLIEDYIMMKYLVKNESFHENIWRDYQLYGMGLYKLVLARHRENGALEESHFDEKYIEALVNEFKGEEFIDMDTKYFDKQNIRLKAEDVGEKNLYGLYYDYDSSFEHGLWGAIRESSLLKCNNPAHKYHCVPDVEDETRLKTVLPDCIMIMNKTISFLDEIYGIPEQLLNEVINFEIKPIAG